MERKKGTTEYPNGEEVIGDFPVTPMCSQRWAEEQARRREHEEDCRRALHDARIHLWDNLMERFRRFVGNTLAPIARMFG